MCVHEYVCMCLCVCVYFSKLNCFLMGAMRRCETFLPHYFCLARLIWQLTRASKRREGWQVTNLREIIFHNCKIASCQRLTRWRTETSLAWLPVVRCRWSHVKLTSRHEQGCSIRYCSMYVCVCVACVLPIPFCNCIDMALVAAASALCWCDKLTDALQRIRLTYSLCWACGFFHGWSQNVSGNSID